MESYDRTISKKELDRKRKYKAALFIKYYPPRTELIEMIEGYDAMIPGLSGSLVTIDRLDLEELIHAMSTPFAAITGLLVAAKRCQCIQ